MDGMFFRPKFEFCLVDCWNRHAAAHVKSPTMLRSREKKSM
jgi:hypothetical protein